MTYPTIFAAAGVALLAALGGAASANVPTEAIQTRFDIAAATPDLAGTILQNATRNRIEVARRGADDGPGDDHRRRRRGHGAGDHREDHGDRRGDHHGGRGGGQGHNGSGHH